MEEIFSIPKKGSVTMVKKIAAISGGGQGIGRATALAFAKAGYAVSIADTVKEAGFEVIRMIRQLGGEAMFICADVSEEAEVRKWFSLTETDLGRVDVLINNAGISMNGDMLTMSVEQFDRVLAVNLKGTFLCSREAAKQMKGKGGSIMHIASTRGLMSEPNTEAYSASKGGILALTHAMAVSLGPIGIRVNAISPGWIETSNWKYSERASLPNHSDRDRLQHPVGRVGVPEDIAQACLYLAGDGAGFITGQNLVIDGGMTVKMIYEE
jgi:NAD(P)-dependent dehydrogenase (short-subunit alcohol dehydrogenase family)